jgi:hypothetical protein
MAGNPDGRVEKPTDQYEFRTGTSHHKRGNKVLDYLEVAVSTVGH